MAHRYFLLFVAVSVLSISAFTRKGTNLNFLKTDPMWRSSTRLLSTIAGSASSSLAPTKTFLLEYMYVQNMIEKRTPHRAAHLEYASKFVESKLLIAGGAIVPEVDRGILVFQANDSVVVHDFVKSDPYVLNGLVESFTVKEWAVVIGKIAG